jgi:hypothetical protein
MADNPTLQTISPEAMPQEVNRQTAFLLYATFCGDVERTAHALNVRAVDLLRVADAEGWDNKLAGILALKKSARPGDLERAINRALNYVQAHIWRQFLDRIVQDLCNMSPAQLAACDEKGKPNVSPRSLADLSSALEKAHHMTYAALNDTAGERTKRKLDEDDATASPAQLFTQMAKAMAEVEQSTTPRAMLFDAQLAQAQRLTEKAQPAPCSPLDDDDH